MLLEMSFRLLQRKNFDVGLQFIEQWKESCSNEQKYQESVHIKISFLESCAVHYFDLGDIRHMMIFVRAFQSVEMIRTFLKSRNLLDELLSVEIETGNYCEAANISRAKGDVLLEAQMLEKANDYKNATQLILFYVIMRSLWSPGSKGWPLKHFKQKEELMTKLKLLSEKVSNSFHDSVCSLVRLLSDGTKKLSDIPGFLVTVSKYQNVCLNFFTLRTILDIYEHSHPSIFIWEPELILDVAKHTIEEMTKNIYSIVTLMHIWRLWKDLVLNILSYLDLVETTDKKDLFIYEELCLQYLGIRKDDKMKRYILLSAEAGFIESNDTVYEQRNKNFIWMNAYQYKTCGQRYWRGELFRVGMKVLEILESLHKFSISSSKVFYPFSKGRIIIAIYEIAKFLNDFGVVPPRSEHRIQQHYILAEGCFFDIVFPLNWRLGTTEGMMTFHDNEIAELLLEKSIAKNCFSRNGNLTHGKIGRLVMLLLLNGKLTEDTLNKIIIGLNEMQEWNVFIKYLKALFDGGSISIPLICQFQEALRSTIDVANWRQKFDYISPHCFIYLVQCLMFFVTSCAGYQGFLFCTKSSLFEMLRCHGNKVFVDQCLDSCHETHPEMSAMNRTVSILKFIITTIENILSDKQGLLDWVAKSSMVRTDYGHVVTKLVIILVLAHMNALSCPSGIMKYLSESFFAHYLPRKFYEILQRSTFGNNSQFLTLSSHALAVIDPLVVICPEEISSNFSNLKALFIGSEELRCRKTVTEKLLDKSSENVLNIDSAKKTTNKRLCNPRSVSESESRGAYSYNPPISDTPVEKVHDLASETREYDKRDMYLHFLQKLEAVHLEKSDHVEVAIPIFDTAIEWFNHKSSVMDEDKELIGMIRILRDELSSLCMIREKGMAPTLSTLEHICREIEDLKSCLRSFTDSGFIRNQETSEDTLQSVEEVETVTGGENVDDVVAEAAEIDAFSNNQGKNKSKKDKKSRKKSRANKCEGKK